ncbi:[Fe-S]-binding protein [Taibaiella sp. KBW10]|uniref:TAT-variant-translocated molybdopterin oxidoreductase n=1 Tax=Taibaiella sp. KBW10 TaxID=2153357 RepID=UPI000F59F54A|nr:TAT-variant-translocated molybdopterin oxidoreductase [Taibaiella sp. KBW10]RQO30175.1 [Fe-S]-binding protein [Taibaiella sp. KBW10]
MSQKRYWKGIEELENTPEYQQSVANEFNEELPLNLSDNLLNATTPRRDFLKFLGFSTLAATVAASCEMPVRKAIPYAIKPEDITPGVPNYYASTFVDNGECVPAVVKTRDGRPIMIEGNTLSKVTEGGTSARMIAATLSLYDKTRLRQPHVDGKPVDTFDAIDQAVINGLSAGNGAAYLLTGTIISPTTEQVIAQFLAKYPSAKHVTYDPISYTGILLANEASYGSRMIPNYMFDKAKTVFSLGADFLGTWISPVEYSKGYTKSRKIVSKDIKTFEMNKHYQVEGMLSMTGANADERATCRPSEYGKVAAALHAAVVTGAAPNTGSKNLDKLITKAAADLKKGNGLVVSGSNDVNVQIIINAINSAIGANGTTIDFSNVAKNKKGIDADMVALVNAMNAGQVGALLMHGVNPIYEYFEGEKFAAGLAKVKTTVSFSDRLDETAQKCKYVVSDHHWLESWGDTEAKANHISFIQPTIAPLFKTRAFQDSLLKWSGATTSYHDMFNAYWVGKLGQATFDQALQDGIIEPATPSISGASFSGNVNDAIAKATAIKGATEYEVEIFQTASLGAGGAWSNNPWLQELPDPITKVAWDNYVMMSPKTAKEKFDAELTSINQVDPKKRVLKVTVGKKEVMLPVIVTPGMHHNVIAIAVGYGRDKGVGMAAADLGKNVYPLVGYNGQTFVYSADAKVEKTADFYPVAVTQTHNSAENRPIIYEYSLEEFKKNPYELIDERREAIEHYLIAPNEEHHEGHDAYGKGDKFDAKKFEEDFRKNGTHYPVHESMGLHWAMSIDLNSCTGCGACVIACHAENNVSVVGKDRVIKVQEMSWLKIDRYFSGDPNDPDTIQTVFQPMLCQHCDNAPCENVCPVSATNHSSEGLNQMAYNRCIGTKYCANNCPFKVRRFNWFDWNDADCFEDNLYSDGRRDDINDDLTRMVLNPDVTVRSRGVMEKCSFCVQRLQDGKLKAKKEGTPLKDHHVSTACQSACGGGCITFGNVNDKESAVFQDRYVNNKERLFYMLESIHVLPNVSYLSKIRNTDEVMNGSEKDEVYKQHI